jgi:predicted DNA-binding transcriptional regulator AlpA
MTDHTHATEPGIAASLEAGSLITINEIRKIFGLGRTAAYELTHRPGFPAPVPISRRCYRWWAKEVAAFAAELREQPATTLKKQSSPEGNGPDTAFSRHAIPADQRRSTDRPQPEGKARSAAGDAR